jgi:hypothetical protein
MGGSRVQEGDEGGGAHDHADPQVVAEPNARHGVERVAGAVGPRVTRPGVRGVPGVVDLHTIDEEEPLAEPVMAPGVRLIAVKTKALLTPFRHLGRGEAAETALPATLLSGRWWSRQRQRLLGCRERRTGRRWR